MRVSCGLLLMLTAPLSAAPVPKELRAGDEMRILGVWHLEKSKYGDGEYGAIGTVWTLGPGGKAIRKRPNEDPGEVAFKFDPKAPVKTFDWDDSFLGVYELDGDTLRVTLGTGTRPTACKPGDSVYYFVFRWVK
jgi:uncharacterized protein (TIGR03067 family)